MNKNIIHISQRSRQIALATTLILLVPIIAACSAATAARADQPHITGQVQASATPTTSSTTSGPLHAFIGTWYNHGGVLKIMAKGQATYDARAYAWCGAGVPKPCDVIEGNLIIDGIHTSLHFNRAQNSTAYGMIDTSTANNKGEPVTMTLNHDHTATLKSTGQNPLNQVVCDLQAPPGTCGA